EVAEGVTQPDDEQRHVAGRGHWRPRSVAVTRTSTPCPVRSRAARPPSSRSTTARTPRTRPPAASTALIASAADWPVVITSATTTTADPGVKHPSGQRIEGCFTPGSAAVLYDDDRGSGREAPFDALSGPVRFRLLAHAKGVELSALRVRRCGDCVGHGIGAERQTADQGGGPPPGREALEPEGADEGEAFSRHAGATRIDVEAGVTS